MVWVGRELRDHLVPTPLPQSGTPPTRPGCSKPHPTWSWTLPGRGHPQLHWADYRKSGCELQPENHYILKTLFQNMFWRSQFYG